MLCGNDSGDGVGWIVAFVLGHAIVSDCEQMSTLYGMVNCCRLLSALARLEQVSVDRLPRRLTRGEVLLSRMPATTVR